MTPRWAQTLALALGAVSAVPHLIALAFATLVVRRERSGSTEATRRPLLPA
ncbi:MAG: hypothetical protein H0W36_00835 [Gemmatimonadetes bacterium]|nr:hypothetical protein [Gemmatimonadota bacterium]